MEVEILRFVSIYIYSADTEEQFSDLIVSIISYMW